ncbi:acyl carrier protein phosphodiesterase [Gilliamella intestini]|uniref:Acyl carrier protein phosphodiesterase n=1 Tax=Gilliamella intestini TaxID=1798183 RepID=A0A1C4ASR1_9GAMM|nr:ACP phosphodiesterase [Gilliamella intestini]SCB97633.1 acyl carrier protein phosphodiesterase [Gilliamella intestini]
MNILAHLHLATLARSSLIGNTVADFVKGDPYLIYNSNVADGIMLHRKIDRLTDSLLEVKKAKLLFRKSHQRVASITLDIVWDHFLSKHWAKYGLLKSVVEFNQTTKAFIQPYITVYPVDYQHFMNAMWQGEWLVNYASIDFVGDVLGGMANRRPKLYLLKETIIDVKQHYAQLESLFFLLYPKICLIVKDSTS